MLVAGDPGSRRQAVHQQQAPAVLAIRIFDHVRFRRTAVIGDGYPHRGPVPGEFHREPAAAPAGTVHDCVAAQFGGDADHVIARWAFGQARRQPPSHQAELARMRHRPYITRPVRSVRYPGEIPRRRWIIEKPPVWHNPVKGMTETPMENGISWPGTQDNSVLVQNALNDIGVPDTPATPGDGATPDEPTPGPLTPAAPMPAPTVPAAGAQVPALPVSPSSAPYTQ